MGLLLPESKKLEWWPSHVQRAFANLGQVLGPAQLNPDILDRVSHDGLPGHRIIFGHRSGKKLGFRKGNVHTLNYWAEIRRTVGIPIGAIGNACAGGNKQPA
jgi:hypothetical protein